MHKKRVKNQKHKTQVNENKQPMKSWGNNKVLWKEKWVIKNNIFWPQLKIDDDTSFFLLNIEATLKQQILFRPEAQSLN